MFIKYCVFQICTFQTMGPAVFVLRWEFIKENKKVKKKGNTLSTKEKKEENTLSTKKVRYKKNDNDQEKIRKEM